MIKRGYEGQGKALREGIGRLSFDVGERLLDGNRRDSDFEFNLEKQLLPLNMTHSTIKRKL